MLERNELRKKFSFYVTVIKKKVEAAMNHSSKSEKYFNSYVLKTDPLITICRQLHPSGLNLPPTFFNDVGRAIRRHAGNFAFRVRYMAEKHEVQWLSSDAVCQRGKTHDILQFTRHRVTSLIEDSIIDGQWIGSIKYCWWIERDRYRKLIRLNNRHVTDWLYVYSAERKDKWKEIDFSVIRWRGISDAFIIC